jgi:hypothetical protein
MSVFKDHKVEVRKLLEVIADDLLSSLSIASKVDHYAKILHGKKLFYLLLYGILDNEKLSQRTLEIRSMTPCLKYFLILTGKRKCAEVLFRRDFQR